MTPTRCTVCQDLAELPTSDGLCVACSVIAEELSISVLLAAMRAAFREGDQQRHRAALQRLVHRLRLVDPTLPMLT